MVFLGEPDIFFQGDEGRVKNEKFEVEAAEIEFWQKKAIIKY